MRNKQLLACSMAMILVGCSGDSPEAVSGDDDWRKTCDTMANIAEVVMTGHQQGYPMQKTMEAFGDVDGSGQDTVEQIIIIAYKQPRYSIKEAQQEIIDAYRDNIYLKCAENLRG